MKASETAENELAAPWYIDPTNRAGDHSPSGGHAPVRCSRSSRGGRRGLGGRTLRRRIGARDHRRRRRWLPPVSVPGVSAITSEGAGYRVAMVNQDGCVGAQVVEQPVTAPALPLPACPGRASRRGAAGDVAVASAET